MYPLLFSAFVTSSVFLCDAFLLKNKRKFHQYFTFFLLLSGVQYLFMSSGLKAENNNIFEKNDFTNELYEEYSEILRSNVIIHTEEKKHDHKNEKVKSEREIRKEFINRCKQKIEYHKNEIERCYEEAKNSCSLFPDIDDARKAEICFTSATAAFYPGDPSQKLMAGIITLGAQYFYTMIPQWQKIVIHLQEAKHHADLYDFYIEVANYNISLHNAENKKYHKK